MRQRFAGAPRGVASSIASTTTATTKTARSTTNCVRASTATPMTTRASRSVRHDLRATACVRASSAQQKAGYATTSVSRNDASATHGTATLSAPTQSATSRPSPILRASRIHRDRSRRDQECVQLVRAGEARRDVTVAVKRRDQDRIELVDVRHQLAVQPWQQGAGLRDRDGEPLVVELVRHHEPVLHPRRRERENPAQEECDGDHRGAVDQVTRPHRRPR